LIAMTSCTSCVASSHRAPMSESVTHMRLVQALLSCAAQHTEFAQFIMYCDEPSIDIGAPPQTIGSSRPDLLAKSHLSGHTLVGEAKTANDIDNSHTLRQLADFFGYLRTNRSGELWVAVPMSHGGTAIRICRNAREIADAASVPFLVSGWMFGPRDQRMARSWHG
jgi:hypothetical protein